MEPRHRRRGRAAWAAQLVAHAVFALHFYTFLLLVLCAGSLVAMVDRVLGGGF